MKKSIWRKVFVLPYILTLIIMAAAAVLMALAFRWGLFDMRGAAIYMFATYALIVACTAYARLMDRWPILKKIFTLPLLPSLLIIIAGAALLIYAFALNLNDTLVAYIAYPLSSYAVVLAITNYIRMIRQLSTSQYEIRIGSRKQYAIRNRALNGFFAGLLIPFLQVVVISFGYVIGKTAKGAATGKAGGIILAILSVVVMLLMVVLGPLFFWIGVACILWWTGQIVRGIVLCALGLIFIVLSAHILQLMMERQKEALRRDFQRT
ncbi:MAG: hypothetical protein K6C08_03760 [Oscillospiraceae bacterium]|nr:hypothetical protein [Oscillospiraceae bacterium]